MTISQKLKVMKVLVKGIYELLRKIFIINWVEYKHFIVTSLSCFIKTATENVF